AVAGNLPRPEPRLLADVRPDPPVTTHPPPARRASVRGKPRRTGGLAVPERAARAGSERQPHRRRWRRGPAGVCFAQERLLAVAGRPARHPELRLGRNGLDRLYRGKRRRGGGAGPERLAEDG